MRVKRISLRFNLDSEDERRAWEALHRLDARSINGEIIARINAKGQADALKDLIRQVVSEELAKAAKGGAVQVVPQAENSEEEIAGVFDFLDSF